MKKVLSLVLAVAVIATLCIALVACGETPAAETAKGELVLPEYEGLTNANYFFPADFKFGLITLHDDASTYDKNFIDAAKAAAKYWGLADSQLIIRSGVEEGAQCTEVANQLVAQGCDVIMADSFGHEDFMIAAAEANPTVQFCHATGYKAAIENLPNYHNAFAAIYEGRYLAGIAAGMKMKADIEAGKYTAAQAKIGYVGAFTYAEVISGYTSFYLGAKSIVPQVTMDVKFTGSWYDPTAEKEAAEALIASGCKLISQHADSMGAPGACEAAGIPNVSYNGSTISACPDTFIVSSRIDWAPYMIYIMAKTLKGEAIDNNYTGTLATGAVKLTNLNGNVVGQDVVDAVVAARTKIGNGTLKVFDTSKFTVNGQTLTEYYPFAAKDDNGNIIAGQEGQNVVSGGEFKESFYQSAPYFDLAIDGITRLNAMY